MTDQLPPEDRPPAQWRRPASDSEALASLPEPSLDNPVSVGTLFLDALDDPAHYKNALLNLTTPESHRAWGDFTDTARAYAAIPDSGYGTQVNYAVGAPDIAYFKILANVTETYQVLDDQIVNFAAVLTLVWRPERGQWLVHSFGDMLRPEDVPRTAAEQ